MSITIAEPSVEERIRRHVESGRYTDEVQVVAEALDAMDLVERRRAEHEEKVEELRVLIAEADAEFDRGEFFEGTPEFWDDLLKEAIEAGPMRVEDLPAHLRPY